MFFMICTHFLYSFYGFYRIATKKIYATSDKFLFFPAEIIKKLQDDLLRQLYISVNGYFSI